VPLFPQVSLFSQVRTATVTILYFTMLKYKICVVYVNFNKSEKIFEHKILRNTMLSYGFHDFQNKFDKKILSVYSEVYQTF
jgi:hypothetical protein